MKKRLFLISIISVILCHLVLAQASPKVTATGKINDASVSITYCSPSVKSREIWGKLVPYNQVWRAGANAATVLETDKELTIEGKKLPAGKYSIYTIPSETEWQVIFNSQVGQWGIKRSGETTRLPENDVLVVKVKPSKNEFTESLVYEISQTVITLKWKNLKLSVSAK